MTGPHERKNPPLPWKRPIVMSESFVHVPSHRVLSISDVLNMIFSLMDRDDNVINACICKQWSDVALDLIWREVVNLPRLLNTLKGHTNHHPKHSGSERASLLVWCARFQKYANRVRTLRHHEGAKDYSKMLDDMAMTRPTLEVLPNLHTLEWLFQDVKCMEQATLFMHHGVRKLVISGPPLFHKSKSSLFIDIAARMPYLHSLDLRVPYAVHLIEADILELLRGLPDLKKVIFPEFYFTSAIVSELSRMKYINNMQFELGPNQGLGDEKDVNSFVPVLEQGAFPMLRNLDMTARLEDVTRFMNNDFAPIKLTSLFIDTYVEHEPEQLHTLLATLSDQCHLLSNLCTKLVHVPAQLKLIPADQITFDTLRPVLSFQKLTTFEVLHKYPVNITLEEIEELASRWPSLRSLYLNEEPLVMTTPKLDLRALIPFTLYCPKLRHLGLFMDATAAKVHPMQELKPFTALRSLSVGTSWAHNPDSDVAPFLAQLCPKECELKANITWTLFRGRSCRKLDDRLLSDIKCRTTRWDTVIDLLPNLIQFRSDLMEKMKAAVTALQEEVENLKTRNHLL
ncbi:hypothetical protein K503DRAFT_724404, partial [Rhizopogon vinicolor AM-OR11-026]